MVFTAVDGRFRARRGRRPFRAVGTWVEHELHVDWRVPELMGERSDTARKLGFYPVQLEPVRRRDAQLAFFKIERRQRFDPRAELLRRQLLLQLRGTSLPKIFHEFCCVVCFEELHELV